LLRILLESIEFNGVVDALLKTMANQLIIVHHLAASIGPVLTNSFHYLGFLCCLQEHCL
jgi:hypothetical protein